MTETTLQCETRRGQLPPLPGRAGTGGFSPKPAGGGGLTLSLSRIALLRPAQGRPSAAAAAPEEKEPTAPPGLYEEACRFLKTSYAAVRAGRPLALEAAEELTVRLDEALERSEAPFLTALHRDDLGEFAVQHSVNVAVFALKLARELDFEPERRRQAGLCGLLHDVGVALLPAALVAKPGPLAPRELEVLRRRPLLARKILAAAGQRAALCAEVAGQVYERIDGSGHPHGLKGDELHEYAKMIGLLDLYEALTHSRPNRERIGFFEAVKYLCQSCKTRFERRHLKAFLRGFTVFPLQSHVLLNSGAVGLVVKTHGDQPLRPEVRMLLDSQGRHVLTERVVRLPAEPLLHIVRCVSEKELARLLQGASASELAPEKGWEEAAGPLF